MLHILWYVDEYILLLQRMFSSFQFSFVFSTVITSQQQNKKVQIPAPSMSSFLFGKVMSKLKRKLFAYASDLSTNANQPY